MKEALHLGQVRGIRIGMNWSLIPVFVLIAWNLAETLLPLAAPGYPGWSYWVFAALVTAAFYASLLAHELGHALVARRHRVRVKGIVLWLFGEPLLRAGSGDRVRHRLRAPRLKQLPFIAHARQVSP